MTTKEIVQFEIAILVYSVAFNYFLFGGSGIMLNKDDLIIPVNEYVSAATINLDCIDVCESIVGQLVYLHECVKILIL